MTFHPRFLKSQFSPSAARIEIDVATRTLILYLGPTPSGTYPVGVGKLNTPSPLGNWAIREKVLFPDWEVLGTRWMGLTVPWGNYGIHGTNAPWSIGNYVSNGCIRMYNADVEKVFEQVYVGTPVHIFGAAYQYRTLRNGSTGYEVLLVQEKLAVLAFYQDTPDGIFGPSTEEAVRAFQRFHALVPDGVVGPATWGKLLSR
ncbi:MAG: L,D-transpeptidase family protein [Firmicutes bacterium]|nr:L,D-transpeptidase family protein [Bacillota bacterium]